MSTLRTRLGRAEEAATPPPGPRPAKYLKQHVHPEGEPPVPTDDVLAAQVAAAEADGFHVVVMRVVYTVHSLKNERQGPDEWQPRD